MHVANIKNVYINQLAQGIDKSNKKDDKLDIDEFSQLLNKMDLEKDNSQNFTKKEYQQVVSQHLNELGEEYSKDTGAEKNFIKCLGTMLCSGLVGAIFGASKKDILGHTFNAKYYGLLGAMAGIPLYIGYCLIKLKTDPQTRATVTQAIKMEEALFKDFDSLEMNTEDRINFLTDKCNFSYKAARRCVYSNSNKKD